MNNLRSIIRLTAGLLALALVLTLAGGANAIDNTSLSTGTTVNVNAADDTNDGTCDSIHCSLREAINVTNALPGTDTITFNIPGPGPYTIQPTSPLPAITDPVIIDGYTQPGASPNMHPPSLGINAILKLELDGSKAGEDAFGLRIAAGDSTVRGLVINRFRIGIGLEAEGRNIIEGNFIGTDITGTVDQGNTLEGILIKGVPNNTVGGATPEARNVISGNTFRGIFITGENATENQVLGNFIGTDASGTSTLGNGLGVFIAEASNNTIGGATPEARNIISSNGRGVELAGSGAIGNQVLGNFIGTDITGEIDLGNFNGVIIGSGASNNTIGGTMPGMRNVISGNSQPGVVIFGSGTSGNVITGNFIGTDFTGTAPLGNDFAGVSISSDAAKNVVGGATAEAGNVIAFNQGDGVFVVSGTGNAIKANSIFSNIGLGINFGLDGVTLNDENDPDLGPNNLQNFPVLTLAISASSDTLIEGRLNSTPNTEFHIEFFTNTACDPAGYGEGKVFLGSMIVATDDTGNTSFTATFSTTVPRGQFITATATDPNNDTSEFSQCVIVNHAMEIDIDIKPGSDANPVNIKSEGKIPLAILSGPDFDAPSQVDTTSLTFGRTGAEASLAFCNPDPEDVDGDGLGDLVCHFHTQATGFQPGDSEGILKGITADGFPLEGRDVVRVVPYDP